MIYLKKLSLLNFKNYSHTELELSKEANCFVGNNGMGKTNILDAIYYLSFCKSFSHAQDVNNVKIGESGFSIKGTYHFNGKDENFLCVVESGKRKVMKRNSKEYERLADHIGLIPLVFISPMDTTLVTEGSDIRRKFLDGIISQYDKNYLQNIIQYNRTLQQRNALLKSFRESGSYSAESLEIWDDGLIKFGVEIHSTRQQFIQEFTPLFQSTYTELTENKESVQLQYVSQLSQNDYHQLLQESNSKDRMTGFTTVGIHKDDLDFTINDMSVRKFSSQGQVKSYVLSLKLAQANLINNKLQHAPLVLLDDIYDKLDKNRVSALMNMMKSDQFGQLFLTDTNQQRSPELLNNLGMKPNVFHIENGNLAS